MTIKIKTLEDDYFSFTINPDKIYNYYVTILESNAYVVERENKKTGKIDFYADLQRWEEVPEDIGSFARKYNGKLVTKKTQLILPTKEQALKESGKAIAYELGIKEDELGKKCWTQIYETTVSLQGLQQLKKQKICHVKDKKNKILYILSDDKERLEFFAKAMSLTYGIINYWERIFQEEEEYGF